MIAKRFTQLLEQLSAKEVERFEDFLRSPYFNKNEKCVLLFQQINAARKSEAELSRELLEKTIFAKQSPHRSYLSVLLSELTRLFRDFLGQEELRQQALYKDHLALQGLLKKNLLKLAANLLKELEERGRFILRSRVEKGVVTEHALAQEKQHKSSLDVFFYQYIFIRDYQLFYLKNGHKNHWVDDREILDRLDEFYLANRLLYSSEVYNLSRITGTDFEEKRVKELQTFILPKHLKQPLVKLLYHTLMTMHETEEKSHPETLTALLKEAGDHIALPELNEIYVNLTNYYIRKALAQADEYLPNLRKAFSIYKQQLTRGHLDRRKEGFPQRLKNSIGMACQLNEYKEAKSILETCKPFLNKEFKESILAFNLATIFFYEGNYQAAFTEVHRVEKVHAYYEHDRQFLRLKIYYELIGAEGWDFDFLANQAKSFREYVRSNKAVSKINRKAYLNFIRFLLKIAKIKYRLALKLSRFKKLEPQIEKLSASLKAQEVMQKGWLGNCLARLSSESG